VTTFWRKVSVISGYFAAVCIIFAALLVSVTRVATPLLNDHLTDFEQFAGHLLNRSITINQVAIQWHLRGPEFIFQQVKVLDPKTLKPVLQIPYVKINLAILESLLKRQPVLDRLKISGVVFTLRQQPSGSIQVEGFSEFSVTDKLTGESLNSNAMMDFIFSEPHLILQDIHLHFIPKRGVKKQITLTQLELKNTGTDHLLSGKAILHQTFPTEIAVHFQWDGNLSDPSKVSAKLYLYFKGLSLPQWFSQQSFHHLHIQEGVGSAKIWAVWETNAWQKIQTTLQFYNLKIQSGTIKKPIVISRLSGNVGFVREQDHQILTGDDILIDLPHHLWPNTGFSVQFSESANLTPILQKIYIDYLDLKDSSEFLQASGFLPAAYEPFLTKFNPQGEIRHFKADIHQPMIDPPVISTAMDFSSVSINAWKNFPGVTNLKGSISWDGTQGVLQLDSAQSTVVLNDLFKEPLSFEKLTGDLYWQKDAHGTWILTAKKIQAVNADIAAEASATLNIPLHDSPVIDLTGYFKVLDASHVSRYLPLKIFDSNLEIWLNSAFQSGYASEGTAILQGRLHDFPFDKGNGKFIISGNVHDIELNYAPHWPVIQHLNGKLIFSSRSMVVDVKSGQILNVPIQHAHGEIPNLGGDNIQMLNVQGIVQGDLAAGFHFIHQSPLQKTIGKRLSELAMQGPMHLALKLDLPLKNLDATKVQGDVAFSHAIFNLPHWNFKVDTLKGAFRFTENSITALGITGHLFNKPILLSLTTKMDEIQAIMEGNINVTDIESWLHLPLSETMQGVTHYEATLFLPTEKRARDSTKVIVQSDLKGITVNLPGVLAKKSAEKTDLQFSMNINENQPLKTKLSYKKLFTAAMVLERTDQQLHLVSADLHLGTGDVNWPNQSGIRITGNIEKMDWATLEPYVSKVFTKEEKTKTTKLLINFDMFRGIDVRVNQLNLAGLKLNNIRIQLSRTLHAFLLNLTNANMNGQITFPSSGTVSAKFERLYFVPDLLSKGAQTPIDPRKLPAISFEGDDVRYEDVNLGRVTFALVPERNGAAIRELRLSSSAYQLNATGQWLSGAAQSRTFLAGDIKTDNLSTLLKAWGLASTNLVGSKGSMHFDLNWPGAPYHPSVQGLSGNVSLNLGAGRIINLSDSTDAKMGLGRILNVLSLQSLPRRLSLNFSDLFEKGYSFDYMKGDFTLKNGNAMTQNTRLSGPIASIEMLGRIGLAAKDFDIKLRVTAYVTASLPVVAAIATANPIAGVAAWMVDKVVSPEVSKITTYEYVITGPWDNPIWDQTRGK